MRVLALDPGERVGWARADIDEQGNWTDLRHGITPLRDMAYALHTAAQTAAYDTVVCEDWRLRPGMERNFIGSSFPSVQFVGMVRLCCWIGLMKLIMQGADTKSTSDKTLKALWPEMYDKVTRPRNHDDAHDMDAIRHLWFYTYRHFPVEQRQEATV